VYEGQEKVVSSISVVVHYSVYKAFPAREKVGLQVVNERSIINFCIQLERHRRMCSIYNVTIYIVRNN
jgi:hypothetical protein